GYAESTQRRFVDSQRDITRQGVADDEIPWYREIRQPFHESGVQLRRGSCTPDSWNGWRISRYHGISSSATPWLVMSRCESTNRRCVLSAYPRTRGMRWGRGCSRPENG